MPDRAVVAGMRHHRRLLHHAGQQQHAGHQTGDHPQHHARTEIIQQITHRHHCGDETHRAPDPDAAVERGFITEMRQRGRLNQRQRGTPEKHHHEQHDKQQRKTLAGKHAEKGQRARCAGQTHDLHAAPAVVRQPAPQMRREDARQLRQRHQHADLDGAHADGIQVQREERREGAEIGEVEKIERGEIEMDRTGHGQSRAHNARFKYLILFTILRPEACQG